MLPVVGRGKGDARGRLCVPLVASPALVALLVALHVAAAFAVMSAELPQAVKLIAWLVLLGSLIWHLLMHAVRWHPLAVTCVEVSGQSWFLTLRNARRLGPLTLRDGRNDGALIQLLLIGGRRRYRVLVPSDAAPPFAYGVLRGLLAMSRPRHDE